MTELTPAEVLADLFDSNEFDISINHDTEAAAKMAIQRLTDAGFEVRAARTDPLELLEHVRAHDIGKKP